MIADPIGEPGRDPGVSTRPMTTDFRFEHVFRAPSAETVLRAYFDPDHLATQDKLAELADRQVVESREDDAVKQCTWTVVSQRQLPVFVRPFVDGGRLRYREEMTWRKDAGEIDLTILPQIGSGRVQINAVYQLEQIGEGQVRRRYGGSVTVDVRLISGKIERAIVGEIEKGMPTMFQCTQDWLDRQRQ